MLGLQHVLPKLLGQGHLVLSLGNGLLSLVLPNVEFHQDYRSDQPRAMDPAVLAGWKDGEPKGPGGVESTSSFSSFFQ